MGRSVQRDKSRSRRATVLWGLACLPVAGAGGAFLLRYFDLGQVLALISFVFLETLVILAVSRMPRTLGEFGDEGLLGATARRPGRQGASFVDR